MQSLVAESILVTSRPPQKESHMPADQKRTATIQLNNKDNPTLVKLSLPHEITERELSTLIYEKIVKDIVFRHTGCSCLSGRISLLIASKFQDALHVDLGPIQAQ